MKTNHIDIWDSLMSKLQNEVSDQTFNAWFIPIKPVSFSDRILKIGVPNDFFKEWVRGKYEGLLNAHLRDITREDIRIDFVVSQAEEKKDPAPQKGWFRTVFPKHDLSSAAEEARLNSKYTFDNFVVGPSNRFAHAASFAITESPARAYNPLFIYGGVGLGKTHLMNAMGNEILKRAPKTKILYISSEEFTNQLINAIQKRTTQEFRKRYRYVDVLLIDDIHFIAGKESTQEEFFHTFNSLYDAHKQIVLSSDRPPKDILRLEERLVSRFEWGLITDIQAPDFETRTAILRKKSEKETIHLPDDLFLFLAENIRTNIRELEGALIRVVAYAKLMKKEVTVDLAKEVLKGMIIEGERKIGIELIQKKVARYFNIEPSDMKAKKRTRAIAYPRQIAMYLSRDLTERSLPEIGSLFGGRDHTTVLHACEKIEKDIKQNEKTRWIIDKLVLSIKN